MTSTIKVDNIQNQCGANIINESSNTITIGASGDTVSLASGASQSGFGRSGTVDWDTTVKTSSFTAVSGNGYFVNTTSAAVTVTLPASPSAGDIVAVMDYANTAETNNITIGRNSSKINGEDIDGTMSINGESFTLVFIDSTEGWKTVNNANKQISTATYVTATGGTVITCGNFKMHVFTGPGTFCVSCGGNTAGSNSVDYMVVGGGASGAAHYGGAGGAGGFRESSGAASGCYTASPLGACVSALPVSIQGYPITVGAGGAVTPNGNEGANNGNPGSNSIFSTITSAGGGGGGNGIPGPEGPQSPGKNGGSGGGGGWSGVANNSPGGTGNTPPVSPPQGKDGGTGSRCQSTHSHGGGGGGATEAGKDAGGNGQAGGCFGKGGDGAGTAIVTSTCYGTPGTTPGLRYFAGGGGGGVNTSPTRPEGGEGGGGNGGSPGGCSADGTTNTGGGAGSGPGAPNNDRSAGGSGIVIIRYKFQN